MGVSVACGEQAKKAWIAAWKLPDRMALAAQTRKANRSWSRLAGLGCLGWIFIGWAVLLIPLFFVTLRYIAWMFAEAAVVAWAVLVSAVWLVSLPFGALAARRGKGPGSTDQPEGISIPPPPPPPPPPAVG